MRFNISSYKTRLFLVDGIFVNASLVEETKAHSDIYVLG